MCYNPDRAKKEAKDRELILILVSFLALLLMHPLTERLREQKDGSLNGLTAFVTWIRWNKWKYGIKESGIHQRLLTECMVRCCREQGWPSPHRGKNQEQREEPCCQDFSSGPVMPLERQLQTYCRRWA